jgi:hypothetical protein
MSCDSENCSQSCATAQLKTTLQFDPNMEYPYWWDKRRKITQNKNTNDILTPNNVNTADNLHDANDTNNLICTTIPQCIIGTLMAIIFILLCHFIVTKK